MKLKHNKKRNTALIFEALSRELTKAIVNKNFDSKSKIISIIKEHFRKGTTLATELELYKGILQSKNMDSFTAEKVIFESKKQYDGLDKEKIFNEQSNLIRKINKELSTEVFSNFVPNYKNLATLYQIFNSDLPAKNKVLLENEMVGYMSDKQTIREEKKQVPSDKLVMKTFVSNFNEVYSKTLCVEQQELLNKYITSFVDNGIELKLFLNEEIGRLKEAIGASLVSEGIKSDQPAFEKTKKVLKTIDSFKERRIDTVMVEKILKIQNLVSEITK
tara:strand:+ start:391 stop:1215 length:825 start_codon:yes stop_codon:yes gene_type:complete